MYAVQGVVIWSFSLTHRMISLTDSIRKLSLYLTRWTHSQKKKKKHSPRKYPAYLATLQHPIPQSDINNLCANIQFCGYNYTQSINVCLPFLWANDIMPLQQGEQKTRKGVIAACAHEQIKHLHKTLFFFTCLSLSAAPGWEKLCLRKGERNSLFFSDASGSK